MRKQITSIVLAIVILLTFAQFGPSLLSAKGESHVQACHYREHRSLPMLMLRQDAAGATVKIAST